MISNPLLDNQKKHALQRDLMAIYSQYGYRQIAIPACEPFRISDSTLSPSIESQVKFMDQSGDIYMLQNDPTLSVMKLLKFSTPSTPINKVCYYAPTYKWTKTHMSEETQIGLENFDEDPLASDIEIMALSVKSLQLFSNSILIDVGDVQLLYLLLDYLSLDSMQHQKVVDALASKNMSLFKVNPLFSNLSNDQWLGLDLLFRLYGKQESVFSKLNQLIGLVCKTTEQLETITPLLENFRKRLELFSLFGCQEAIQIDLTLKPDLAYYNGLVIKGFIKGCPTHVLSGGRYDNLIKRIQLSKYAAGFALNLNLIMDYVTPKLLSRKRKLLLLESDLSAKGINEAQRYREEGFDVTLRIYTHEKNAIDQGTLEGYELICLLKEECVKVINLKWDNSMNLTYPQMRRLIQELTENTSIH